MRTSWPLSLFLLLGACANACGDAPGPLSKTAQPRDDIREPYEGTAPEGTPVPGSELSHVLPDTLSTFRAEGSAQSRSVPLSNKGQLVSARRSYRDGSRTLIVEITDSLHAPEVRSMVERAVGVSQRTETSTFRGTEIQAQRAVVQWHGPDKLALVNLLVSDRFLVNFKLRAVEDTVEAEGLAASLSLSPLLTLASGVPHADAASASVQTTSGKPLVEN